MTAYLAEMTSRLLLTLLAFFTGLSAQESTLQARAMPCDTYVAAVSALATVQSARAEAVLARPECDAGATAVDYGSAIAAPQLVAPSPTVLTRIDRAHE